VELVERALAGDVDAAIEWLTKFGGPEWQLPDPPQTVSSNG
jgi:hypothetical protein